MQSFIDRRIHIYYLKSKRYIYVIIRIDAILMYVLYRKIKIDFVMRWETHPNKVKLKKQFKQRNERSEGKREYDDETTINNKAHRFSMMKWYDKVEQIRTRERM